MREITDLKDGIALYTAMYEDLEAGGVLTDAQLAACLCDPVLSVLFFRARDFGHFEAARRRGGRVAADDSASLVFQGCFDNMLRNVEEGKSAAYFADTLRAACEPSRRVRSWRRSRPTVVAEALTAALAALPPAEAPQERRRKAA